MHIHDVIIIGGGQAGLSVAYFLRRTGLDYIILDEQDRPGGAWLQTWDGLKLFSPTTYSSLSGWQMPPAKNEYPSKDEFIDYLTKYEKRYNFPVIRNTKVAGVFKQDDHFEVKTNTGSYVGKAIVSATGTAKGPYIPEYPGVDEFLGIQIHSLDYRSPEAFTNKKVLVVGGGNSGAQILAEVSKVAKTKWVTLDTPNFLPVEIDGRYLFHQATAKFLGNQTDSGKASLSDIVQVESVQEALGRNVYQDHRPFQSFYDEGIIWKDGNKELFDAVIWCTGFKPDFSHLKPLNVIENGRIKTRLTRSLSEPGLWLVGYGNWTGFASATIYGVGKTARQTAKEISSFVGIQKAVKEN